jgi:hypothetical protein
VFNRAELYATIAWIGSKPDVAVVNEYQKVSKEVRRGVLVRKRKMAAIVFLSGETPSWIRAWSVIHNKKMFSLRILPCNCEVRGYLTCN